VIFAHSLAFVLGFTLVFTLLGASAGLLGRSLNLYMPIIQKFGAIMLVIFALTTMGVFRWLADWIARRVDLATNPAAEALVSMLNAPNRLLYAEKRVAGMHQVGHGWGYLGSAAVGVTFAAGWTPCIGPILATILFLAGDSQTAWQGAALLAIYSLGLGIPFLITGAAFSSTTRVLRGLNRYAGVVSILSALSLFYVAYLLWTDSLAALTTQYGFLNQAAFTLNEWVYAAEDWVMLSSGSGGNILSMNVIAAAPLALTAGIISFFSPCVLPLVPAYIGYLSGAAVGRRA
jgi:cytochrome c-type biogenesis protein